jgi:hypothetical protein
MCTFLQVRLQAGGGCTVCYVTMWRCCSPATLHPGKSRLSCSATALPMLPCSKMGSVLAQPASCGCPCPSNLDALLRKNKSADEKVDHKTTTRKFRKFENFENSKIHVVVDNKVESAKIRNFENLKIRKFAKLRQCTGNSCERESQPNFQLQCTQLLQLLLQPLTTVMGGKNNNNSARQLQVAEQQQVRPVLVPWDNQLANTPNSKQRKLVSLEEVRLSQAKSLKTATTTTTTAKVKLKWQKRFKIQAQWKCLSGPRTPRENSLS